MMMMLTWMMPSCLTMKKIAAAMLICFRIKILETQWMNRVETVKILNPQTMGLGECRFEVFLEVPFFVVLPPGIRAHLRLSSDSVRRQSVDVDVQGHCFCVACRKLQRNNRKETLHQPYTSHTPACVACRHPMLLHCDTNSTT